MEVKRQRNLFLEISKTLNYLNFEYMKEIFHKTANYTHRPINIIANKSLKAKDLISGIPYQIRLKKKPITITIILTILLINGLVLNVNAVYIPI